MPDSTQQRCGIEGCSLNARYVFRSKRDNDGPIIESFVCGNPAHLLHAYEDQARNTKYYVELTDLRTCERDERTLKAVMKISARQERYKR
jgi:hypothetical protein